VSQGLKARLVADPPREVLLQFPPVSRGLKVEADFYRARATSQVVVLPW